jgi:UDP-N-acetylglucosamine 2-epimerase (non-hydrolysing)
VKSAGNIRHWPKFNRAGSTESALQERLHPMKILHVVGARPNFMKVAPVYRALRRKIEIIQTIVHTGQHYDVNMSDVFFRELGIPEPEINLLAGSGSHARQTAAIMDGIEPVLLDRKPDLTLVYGDVNSTAAAALVSAKMQIPVGHIEAGLRSFDRSMPEEINRVVTDCLADALFTPTDDANENLLREGIPKDRIFLVGNVMIDTLLQAHPLALERFPSLAERLGLTEYGLVTLHRPSNVDDEETLLAIVGTLREISHELPLVFPIHPRTSERLGHLGSPADRRMRLVEPMGYLDFLALAQHARVVITDSGGIQEETTCLGVPCLTVRETTERPITVSLGTNILVGRDMDLLKRGVRAVLAGKGKLGELPALWDGHAGERISGVIAAEAWRVPSAISKVSCIAK